jgi:hypothetical protein
MIEPADPGVDVIDGVSDEFDVWSLQKRLERSSDAV